MARVIALAAAPLRISQVEILRMLIVCTCGLALIAAGQGLPV